MCVATKRKDERFVATLIGILLAACSWTLTSCKSSSTDEDRQRLEAVRSAYGNRYEFEFEQGLYLSAKNMTDTQPKKEEAIEIYRVFWFEGANRRKTTYVYLNIYNRDGVFQFQISWDPAKNDFGFSQRAYY